MMWALQGVDIKPIIFAELYLKLDQHLWSSSHVEGYLKGHPLMRSGTSHAHLGITGKITRAPNCQVYKS